MVLRIVGVFDENLVQGSMDDDLKTRRMTEGETGEELPAGSADAPVSS